jgi:AcrR family transcriptional regulator
MSPEERRKMIIRSTLPLVAEHGAAVTTSQIAQAAGIGEATIFRVFADKGELLDECVAEALKPDTLMSALSDIPLDQPLAARLTEAADSLQAHLARMGTVIGALHATGHTRPRPAPPATSAGGSTPRGAGVTAAEGVGGRDESLGRIREAVEDLFVPERDSLRMGPERLAALFLGLMFARSRPVSGDVPALEDVVDLFLNGALK